LVAFIASVLPRIENSRRGRNAARVLAKRGGACGQQNRYWTLDKMPVPE
jgi:hypothetical protein